MSKEYDVIDIFGLMEDEAPLESERTNMSVDDALVEVLNLKNEVDICYISDKTGLDVHKVIGELEGVIYQQPEIFEDALEYDVTIGWVVSSKYLSGNIRNKLIAAKKANKRFHGKFNSNVEALKKILPQKVDIDDIHLSLGATWVPVEEISLFLKNFLNLKTPPEVVFYDDLKCYKIVGNEETSKSVLNTITYGVRGDINKYFTKQYFTALDIAEQTLNAKTIKAFDYLPKKRTRSRCYEYEPVFNKVKTIEAQNKQKTIIDAFKDYVYADKSRIARFESYYNDKMVGYTYSAYNGDFLKFADLNKEVKLYKHQKDAIARVLLSGNNVLLSHDVGTGKTYEMIVSIHELHRMGISKKNLVVVPNNVLEETVKAHRKLYHSDNILAVYPKDFTPSKRDNVLEDIRCNDYVAVYMAYSSFDMIVMSKQYYIDKLTKEIRKIKTSVYNAQTKHEKRALNKQENLLAKKLAKYTEEEQECPWMTFDKLGIETLVVDEAHNYKNIPIRTRADGIVGLGSGTSKKCREMLEKAQYVPRLVFATGTPLTNSLADLFTFQTYLQPELLAYHNIDTFDTWVNTFGQRETTIECDVDANSTSLRTMTRFSSFHNLGELMSLFSQVCDFHHMPKDEEGLPEFKGHTDVCVPKNEAQHEYIKSLSERTEKIRNKEVRRTEDNLLKVTVDGRLAAVDIRLVDNESVYCGNDNKISMCAKQVNKVLQNHPESVQIVFSDIGIPKEGFNVYDELTNELVKLGVDKNTIAYVHDATSEPARAKLFSAMNKGTLKVVLGSTQKLGVGVNVQEKLIAVHHLSVPWRPADMVQREGRILRKGNTSDEVYIFRYITEGSFDAYSWQLLENKQRFISSFLSGTSAARDMDDIADTVLTYAEVKALAIGNPLIKQRVEVANKLERMKITCRSRQKEMQQLRVVIGALPEKIRNFEMMAQRAEADYKLYRKSKTTVPNEERIAFGEELLEALSDNVECADERYFDEYQGFFVFLPANMHAEERYILIKGYGGNEYRLDIEEDKTPLGCSKSIDYILEHLNDRADRFRKNAETAIKQKVEAQKDLDNDNQYLKEVEMITAELAEIDRQLEEAAEKVAV